MTSFTLVPEQRATWDKCHETTPGALRAQAALFANILPMTDTPTPWAETRIIIPVRNGGARWQEAAAALARCVPDPALVAVIDSSSTDGSDEVARAAGFQLARIPVAEFNHGRTRQQGVDQFCAGRRFVIFLTQDAVVESPASLTALLGAFDDPSTGAAYGRQRPHRDARPFGAHGVTYLYPETSHRRRLADAPRFGIRTAYLSNSFAAYRIDALRACGGFSSDLILGEDTRVALKMLLAGLSIAYCSEATVRHSHDYTIFQEMQRYFDFGVLHAQLPELLEALGEPEGEGFRFVASEFRYMARHAPWLLPMVPVRNAAKYAGYRLGRHFRSLPLALRRRLSMTRGFWDAALDPHS